MDSTSENARTQMLDLNIGKIDRYFIMPEEISKKQALSNSAESANCTENLEDLPIR